MRCFIHVRNHLLSAWQPHWQVINSCLSLSLLVIVLVLVLLPSEGEETSNFEFATNLRNSSAQNEKLSLRRSPKLQRSMPSHRARMKINLTTPIEEAHSLSVAIIFVIHDLYAMRLCLRPISFVHQLGDQAERETSSSRGMKRNQGQAPGFFVWSKLAEDLKVKNGATE